MNTLLLLSGFRRAAFLLLALAACSAARADWRVGDAVPNLAAYDLAGEMPELKGKVTYIDFWASWCPPCKASFPAIEQLYQQRKGDGFQVIAISVDSSERAMNSFLKRANPSFATIWDRKQALVEEAGIEVMPTSFLVDANGVIRSAHTGYRKGVTDEELAAAVDVMLRELGSK